MIEKPIKTASAVPGRKRKLSTNSLFSGIETKTMKTGPMKPTLPQIPEKPVKLPSAPVKKSKPISKAKTSASEPKITEASQPVPEKPKSPRKKNRNKKKKDTSDNLEQKEPYVDMYDKYPVLKDQLLIERFLKVELSNNQKGRIRQAIKESLKGTSNSVAPDIIHNKIQSILKKSTDLTDSDLRRVRILYNLLKTALLTENVSGDTVKKVEKIKKDKGKDQEKDRKNETPKKVRGPKRYVVFLGNLPLNINKEKIMSHFSEMNEHIKDIRFPKKDPNKKSAMAYLELTNEPSFEFALSKHHSMLGNRRINVLYSAPKNGKLSKSAAKSKSAKMLALQRSGKLVGSLPLNKKRSQRRLKAKQAQAKENQEG